MLTRHSCFQLCENKPQKKDVLHFQGVSDGIYYISLFFVKAVSAGKKQQQKEKTLNHSELRLASTQTCLTGILTQDVSVSRVWQQQSKEGITASPHPYYFQHSKSIAEAATVRVNIMYDSTSICIGQYEAAFIFLHYFPQMSPLCLKCHLWRRHILLHSMPD